MYYSHHRLFKVLCFGLCLPLLYACGDQKAQQIVDAGIEAHGGSAYKAFRLEFDFRNRHYTASRNDGLFVYSREFTDSTGQIKDVLNNDGFVRYRDGERVSLTDERAGAFYRSVNSVIYFALLPFGLNDAAVNKEWIGETTIDEEPYNIVRVTFDQPGGGDDHSDVFLYWFHRDQHTMDYLAYSYETDGGGLRFRKAVNPRRIEGILLQDYINYKPKDETVALEQLLPLFTSGQLEKLSEINLVNTSVSPYQEGN